MNLLHSFKVYPRFNISDLTTLNPDELLQCLARDRFAILRLPSSDAQLFDRALLAFKAQRTFRFPPHDSADSSDLSSLIRPYSALQAASFNLLYHHCRQIVSCLAPRCAAPLPLPPEGPVVAESALPFGPTPLHNPYHPTFINMFNYDHGSLNAHLDRGLITLNYAFPMQNNSKSRGDTSRLWLRNYEEEEEERGAGAWICAEDTLEAGEALLFVGEQLSRFLPLLRPGYHAVRCDPLGDRLVSSHKQRDPQSSSENNRLSMAMVMSLE